MARRAVLLALTAVLAVPACSAPKEITLAANFADVGDLVNRANVQQSDSVVGRVSSIELQGWTAHVTMILSEGTRVPEGSRAIVRSTSLLGEKFVDLQPPQAVTADTPNLRTGALIPIERTGKTPEVEEVFSHLGAILASGALKDLGAFVTATARIVEGQQDDVGRALDGTARLIEVLAGQREALADAVDHLASASATFAGGTETLDRFLDTTSKVGTILAGQKGKLDELVVQLDRLGQPAGALMRDPRYRESSDRAIKALITILPQLKASLPKLETALHNVPSFAKLFAQAIPGDYIQLDVHTEG